jgi:membrane-associated phospholipid phosphatase
MSSRRAVDSVDAERHGRLALPGARLWHPLVLAVVSLLVFAALAVAVAVGASVPGGRAIHRFLEPYRDKYLVGNVAHFLSGGSIVLAGAAVTAAVLLVLALRSRVRAAAFFAASLGAPLVIPVLKTAFDRLPPEPPDVPRGFTGGSFPSGHATFSMALAVVGVLTCPVRARRPLLVVAVLLVAAVGLSAVIVGNHWPSDVVAGWSFALAWVSALYLLTAGVREAESNR